MSDDARKKADTGRIRPREPGSDPQALPHVSMDIASNPTAEAMRAELLADLTSVDPADAPDVADALADVLARDLDGPIGESGTEVPTVEREGSAGESPD